MGQEGYSQNFKIYMESQYSIAKVINEMKAKWAKRKEEFLCQMKEKDNL